MSRRLPISGAPPQAESAFGGLGEAIWSRGRTFLELVQDARAPGAALDAAFDAVRLPAELEQFFSSFPRRVRVLALATLDEADSQRILAQAERLFSLGNQVWMRTFPLAEHPDLVQRFPSPRWPLLVFFGDDRREFARWAVPAPADAREAPSRRTPEQPLSAPADQGETLARDLARILAAHANLPEP